ncbi:MAG: guanitoxin biosynthesis MATE family efflux transporter GntT [Nostoc sp. ChiQUE02]|uniref:guanitoxin biosynthesis MATE family efflux transporter GntT n=1 Tax=Nostoc sp. ChiQUE02 TaxID=3075377 RepID=UPI002AD39967|nr:guanitoxin biosynthesis MATE family efflux transporter GntT [Nostoc sp. ChiQUE02]MDZ8234086.1 guanitoxin biosynthesis MATE family efflux transporter GntT [Nostoc sp. ChiQUE02]
MNTKISSQYDFLPRFLQLATVNAASVMMIPLAGAISVAFLGHLPNISYLAGVALGALLFDSLYESCSFIRSGTIVMTSQAVGRDDREAILLAGLQNALIALGLGMLLLLLQYPLEKLGFMLLNATPEVKLAGIAYFNSRIWGAPAALINLVLIGWFLGREQNRKVLLLTIIGNAANVALDYLFIVHWDWSSMGAGLAQAISQYLTLFVGLVMFSREVPLQEVVSLTGKVLNLSALQSLFVLNRNLSVRSVVIVSMFVLFGAFGATLGTNVLAENALLLQVVALSMYMCDGVESAIVTLSGNFKGQGAIQKFVPLLQIGLGTNLVIGLVFGLAAFFFPDPIFQIFTNHSELIEAIKIYIPWLILLLVGAGVAYTLDGYFSGLAEGAAIRNAYLIDGSLGIIFLFLATFYFHSNHILWLALSIFMLSRTLTLGLQIPMTLKSNQEEESVANLLSNSSQTKADESTSFS